MQRMLMRIYIIILIVLMNASCSNNNQYKIKKIDVDYKMMVAMKDKPRTIIFPWQLNFEIKKDGSYIVPKDCYEFRRAIVNLYPMEFKKILYNASTSYSDNKSIKLMNLDELNDFYDFFDDYIEHETGELLNSYFLSKSILVIMQKWNIYNLIDEQKIVDKYSCIKEFEETNELSAISLLIVNALLQ
ncbi:MAG: hypothetical protein DWP95_05680 [Proteobacteria bacterium]|nr:MAG: hypothetical protein DWP95_05680 [Pseudomonadota bacterium]